MGYPRRCIVNIFIVLKQPNAPNGFTCTYNELTQSHQYHTEFDVIKRGA
jgi:hypothetical protein